MTKSNVVCTKGGNSRQDDDAFSKTSFKESSGYERPTGDEHCDLGVELTEQYLSLVPRLYLAEPMSGVTDLFVLRECDKVRFAVREKLGWRFAPYFPAEATPIGSKHSGSEIYAVDQAQVRDSDLIIFHLVAASTGLGIEAEIASLACVPAVVISRRGSAHSRMFEGSNLTVLRDLVYTDDADLRNQLASSLADIERETVEIAHKRHTLRRLASNVGFGREVLLLRIVMDISREVLAKRAMVSEHQLYRLECGDSESEVLSHLQLLSLANELKFTFTFTGDRPGAVFPSRLDSLRPAARRSLDNLVDFVRSEEGRGNPLRGERRILQDSRVRKMWKAHHEMTEYGLVGREPLDNVLTSGDWQKLYHESLL